jgi:hypothetical protein
MKKRARRPSSSPAAARQDVFFNRDADRSFFRDAGLQPRLVIGPVDDPLERQADRTADRIVAGAANAASELQRRPLAAEEETLQARVEGGLHRQPREEEEEPLQSKPESAAAAPSLSQTLDATRGGGQPLPSAVGREMESAFGVGLSSVRVHTDEAAHRLSSDLKAQAFTRGRDIYFAAGRFTPDTRDGRHLLAHELTHVLQQRGEETGGGKSARQKPRIQRRETEGQPAPELAPVTPEIAREFLEDTIRFWDDGRDYFRYREIDQELLTTLLDSWRRMMDNGWRLIEEHLDGDEELLGRLKESYRASVSAIVAQASRDLGVPELELYAQHNLRIAWWLRRRLAPREEIVFILGAGDAFYESAIEFFQLTGARIVRDPRSLTEVRDWLAANPPASGLPWGDVSIVVHANLEGGMQTTVTPGGARVTPRSLRQAIEDREFQSLPNEVVDDATRLRIRGCALGRNQEILVLLRSAFGGNEESPAVYAPVHLQNYEYQWSQPRGGERTTTSAEEYFQEFWYVGYPARPAPNRVRLVEMFSEKYPDAGVDWARMLRTPGATARRPYSMSYTISGARQAPPAGAAGAAGLTRLVRQSVAGADDWTDITETSRQADADGRITITFSYRQDGEVRTGASVSGLLPRMTTQAQYRAFLDRQSDLLSATRPLEEGSDLTADDFHWALARTANADGSHDYAFTGRRGFLRIQRDLVEPDPERQGQTRRVRPDISDASQFGREEPADYPDYPTPGATP